MSRKGFLGLDAVSGGVLFVIILITLVVFETKGFGFFNSGANILFPDLNETGTVAPGISYAGILVSPIARTVSGSTGAVSRPNALLYYLVGRRNLSYYTGDSWIEVKSAGLNLETKSLNAIVFRDALAELYFSTPRVGEPEIFLANGQKLSVYLPSGGLFDGNGLTTWYNGSSSVYLAPNNIFYKDHLLKNPALGYGSAGIQAATWRDQILQGFSCEKVISLTFEERDQEITQFYTLKKDEVAEGFYLYVDLDDPVESRELYGEGCYSHEP